MFSMNNDKDRMRFILIGMICTGLVCVVIALCMKLSNSAEVEEIAVDELLQQYWQEQALDTASPDNAETETEALLSSTESTDLGDASMQHVVSDEAMKEQVAETGGDEKLEAPNPPTAESTANDGKIDINQATAEQLQQLKGIGPSKAKAIVEDREQKGSFKSIADIKRVKGIGEKLFSGIEESIVANP